MRRIVLITFGALALGGGVTDAAVQARTIGAAETLSVSNTSATLGRSTTALVASHSYELVVRGTVSDWCSPTSCPTGDPAKVPQPDVGQDALYGYAQWRFPTPQITRQLLINGLGLDQLAHKAGQIPYSSTHVYRARVTGISGRLTFVSADAGSSSNNSGAWTVTITDLGTIGRPPAPSAKTTSSPTRSTSGGGYMTWADLERLIELHGLTIPPQDGSSGPYMNRKSVHLLVDSADCGPVIRFGVKHVGGTTLWHGFKCLVDSPTSIGNVGGPWRWLVYVVATTDHSWKVTGVINVYGG